MALSGLCPQGVEADLGHIFYSGGETHNNLEQRAQANPPPAPRRAQIIYCSKIVAPGVKLIAPKTRCGPTWSGGLVN